MIMLYWALKADACTCTICILSRQEWRVSIVLQNTARFLFFLGGVKILFFVSKIVSLHSFLVLLEGLLSSCMFNITNSNSKHGAVFPDRWIYGEASVPIDGEMAPLRSEFAKTRRSQERWKFHSDVVSTQITRISGISICSRTPSNTFAFWNELT